MALENDCHTASLMPHLESYYGMINCRLTESILRAVGMPRSVHGVARVMFCRATFCHPELDEHEFRRDLLGMSRICSGAREA